MKINQKPPAKSFTFSVHSVTGYQLARYELESLVEARTIVAMLTNPEHRTVTITNEGYSHILYTQHIAYIITDFDAQPIEESEYEF